MPRPKVNVPIELTTYTIPAIARSLNVSYRTVKKAVDTRLLKAFKINREYKVFHADYVKYLSTISGRNISEIISPDTEGIPDTSVK